MDRVLLPTLAWDEQLVFAAIAVVVMFIGWIVNWLRGMGESSNQPPRRGDASGGDVSLDEMAARRREQLRREAQARRGGAAPDRAGGASAEPTNLTMAERIERARAQEAYRQRAEGLRQSEGQRGPQPSPADPRQQELGEAERRREVQEAQMRQREAQAQAERRRQAGAPQQRSQAPRSSPPRRPHRPVASPPAAKRAPEPLPGVAEQAEPVLLDDPDVPVRRRPRRRRTPTIGAVGEARGRDLGILLTGGATLRQAMILKEVLDKPLSLREDHGEWS